MADQTDVPKVVHLAVYSAGDSVVLKAVCWAAWTAVLWA